MARKKDEGKGLEDLELVPDELIESLQPDAECGPPKFRVLTGFLARGPSRGSWRLYSNPGFDAWTDLDAGDVIYSKQVDADSLLPVSALWVKQGAGVPCFRPTARARAGDFLNGEFTTLIEKVQLPNAALALSLPTNSLYCTIIPTFCNWMCHTMGGGATCKLEQGGREYHDSIDFNPCKYTLGFDPGC